MTTNEAGVVTEQPVAIANVGSAAAAEAPRRRLIPVLRVKTHFEIGFDGKQHVVTRTEVTGYEWVTDEQVLNNTDYC